MLIGNNISFLRGQLPLFSGLSFSLRQGELLAIKGANGTGKSTFLRILTGFIHPQPDTLFWNGEMVSKTTLSFYQQNLLYVGHKLCLHPEASLRDQIQLWKNLYKISMKDMEEALENWGLAAFHHKKISHLSQGQQKRLSLSRCSWLKRCLWILDEPEAGLDQESQQTLRNALSAHLAKGGMVVQATHQNLTASSPVLEGGTPNDTEILEAYGPPVQEILL